MSRWGIFKVTFSLELQLQFLFVCEMWPFIGLNVHPISTETLQLHLRFTEQSL